VTADYGSMTLLDDISGTPAESLQYGIEAANVRGVFVNGTGVSAFVTDGSGKVGPINYVSDATIDTQAKATNYATNVLAGYAVPIRGQLRRESWLPTLDIHPGSSLFLTDARLGIVNVGRIITNLSKTFEGGKLETWVVAFGGNPPSVSTLIRKLTAQPRS
jgi:hypothetical protein